MPVSAIWKQSHAAHNSPVGVIVTVSDGVGVLVSVGVTVGVLVGAAV